MDLKEYVLPRSTFIGGWYIPSQICDELISFFKNHKANHAPGTISDPPRVDLNYKDSIDIFVDPKYNNPSIQSYLKYLQQVIFNYQDRYEAIKDCEKFGLVEPIQIQYYKTGKGFKKWHFERSGKSVNRCLVFMTYLNNVPGGGTHFKYQNLTVTAKKGLTLMWPPDFTHTHKGQISSTQEKYIITGWLGYN